jgi:hypothetical protein
VSWTTRQDGNVYDHDGKLRIATYVGGDSLQMDTGLAELVKNMLNLADEVLGGEPFLHKPSDLSELIGNLVDDARKAHEPTQTFESQETLTHPAPLETNADWGDPLPTENGLMEDDHYVVGTVEAMTAEAHPSLAFLEDSGYLLIKVTHAENVPEAGTTVKVVPYGDE